MLNKIEAQERLVHSPGLSQDRGQSLYDQAVNLAVCGIEHARRRFDYGSMFSRIKLRGGESLEEVPRKAFFIVFGGSEPRLGCDLIEDLHQSAKLVRFESTFRSGIHHTSPPQTHPERRIAPRLAAFKIPPPLRTEARMSAEQLHILQHSLGLDPYGRGTMYRNSFVTGAGSTDHPACMALVEKGFMTRRAKVQLYGGDDIFTVTDAGKRAVVAESPKAPTNVSSGTSPIRQRGESDG